MSGGELLTDRDHINQLADHLFRHESGKMVSILTRIFGPENIDLAEDVVHDSFVEAIMHWTYQAIPDNPSAWLFRVAKNKAINIINREKFKTQYVSEEYLQSERVPNSMSHLTFSDEEILDDQLRMMFACCHPSISIDSQVALTLKTLCGFSIPEIAKAFLTDRENINKRLVRARQKIRSAKIPLEVPYGADMEKRLSSVLETIYFLFNEGYNASTGEDLLRYELAEEAIRLAEIIVSHPAFKDKSDVYALLALMQLDASRFKARQDNDGNILTLEKQDRSAWDYALMEKGFINLEKAAMNSQLSSYHLLAGVSAYHCSAASYESTDWKSILELYSKLIEIDNSPVVLLNRAIALSKVNGAEKGLAELDQIPKTASIEKYYLFYVTQAEFYIQLNQFSKAIESIQSAIPLAPLTREKSLLRKRLEFCRQKAS
jgi:RNA polymerase sigma-70 factor (ECF subfamily)